MDTYEQMTEVELERACDVATARCQEAQDRGDAAAWSGASQELAEIKEQLALLRCPFTTGPVVVEQGGRRWDGVVDYIASIQDRWSVGISLRAGDGKLLLVVMTDEGE